MNPNSKKVLLIGVDQSIPYLIKRFINEGILPNINQLTEGGVIGEAYPCPPCDTPTNWTTIATGATTAVHGATSFYLHIPGEPLDYGLKIRSRSSLSRHCGAEYIWDTADRNGLTPLVLNYPAGWPSNFKNGVMSLLTWPLPESLPRTISYPIKLSYTLDSSDPIYKISKAKNSSKNFNTKSPLLQIIINIENKVIKKPFNFKVYIIDQDGTGYNSLFLPMGTENEWQSLKIDEWSNWIPFNITTIHGILPCLLKLQLLELAPDGSKLRLQLTSIYNTKGWTTPEEFGEKIIKNAMVYDIYDFVKQQKVDYMIEGKVKSFLSYAGRETFTIARAIEYFKKNISWDLCFFHIHILDSVNHRTLAQLYEDSPFYTEKSAERALEHVETAYKIIDELVGSLMKNCVDKNTTVIFLSDHGALPAWKVVNIPLAFVRSNLLTYKWDQTAQKFMVDWKRTVAFPYLEPCYVWVNLKDREPHGIVSPSKYELVRDRIIESLYQLKDPETGDKIVKLALRKEDAEYLGQNGERIGDVVYFLNPPYMLFDAQMEQLNAAEQPPDLLIKPEAYNAVVNYAAHAYYLPTATLGNYSISVPLIINGPEIKKGHKLKDPVNLIDIAPTIANLLKIPKPKTTQGRVLHEIVE
ncbi:MAG: alkaline phosphatase family protein [Promethearchaeota archaeon]